MAEDNQVVDPVTDNSTPPPQESIEVTPPSPEDNGESEPAETVEPVTPDLDKEERWKQQLQGSKAEALKWKSEFERLQNSMQEKNDADIPISDADLAAFNALAKKLGFVTKQELEQETQVKTYKQTQEESLSKFLTEHPEYNKVGDADSDKKWKELQKELTLYNTRPSDPKLWYDILKRAHNNLNSNVEIAQARGESVGMAKANLAEQAKIGSRASGEASTPKKRQTPDQQQFERELEEQLKKRPYYKGK